MIEGSQNAATESVGPSKTQHFPEHTPDPVTSSALPADELAREQALAQALVEEKDSESRTRHYSGPWAYIISLMALAFSLFQLAASTFWTLGCHHPAGDTYSFSVDALVSAVSRVASRAASASRSHAL